MDAETIFRVGSLLAALAIAVLALRNTQMWRKRQRGDDQEPDDRGR